MATEVEGSLALELYAGLKVVQEKQSEINRRIGNIERSLDARTSEAHRIAQLEADLAELKAELEEGSDSRRDWWTWGLQTIGSIILSSAVIAVGAKLGVTLYGN